MDLTSEFNLEEKQAISMERIEEKYALEDEMLRAVSEGNLEAAAVALRKFAAFPNSRYRNTNLQTSKDAMVVLNTLLRKAVQNAEVHPAHIDYVSGKFAEKIRNTKSLAELQRLNTEMARKYCLLVRSYSLKGYSALTQRTLNYIDFNITEELSLSYIAEKLNVSRNHLSSHFKKEMGETITDYINGKRIQESLKYLNATNLPVSDVALRVGMYDLNYFSRVFKKIMGMTPSQYRSMLQIK